MSAGWSAGAPGCTTSSCCRIMSSRISTTRWTSLASFGFRRSIRNGSRRISNSASRRSARSRCATCELELRHALEPWHVLGEEQAAGGTARYVDSSAERVQAKVSGWVDERYVLACNGVAVPLQPTERVGEYVAGVRFKAWNPPSALHPTIGAQVAAGVRRLRPLDRPQPRRPDPPRRASGRPQLRYASRSTPTRPRRAAARASPSAFTRRDRCRSRAARRGRNIRARSICAASRDRTMMLPES